MSPKTQKSLCLEHTPSLFALSHTVALTRFSKQRKQRKILSDTGRACGGIKIGVQHALDRIHCMFVRVHLNIVTEACSSQDPPSGSYRGVAI